jgi:hypothetical protein
MAEIRIHEGESIENALRRFKRKVMMPTVDGGSTDCSANKRKDTSTWT